MIQEKRATSDTLGPEIAQVGPKKHSRLATPKSKKLEYKYESLAAELQQIKLQANSSLGTTQN